MFWTAGAKTQLRRHLALPWPCLQKASGWLPVPLQCMACVVLDSFHLLLPPPSHGVLGLCVTPDSTVYPPTVSCYSMFSLLPHYISPSLLTSITTAPVQPPVTLTTRTAPTQSTVVSGFCLSPCLMGPPIRKLQSFIKIPTWGCWLTHHEIHIILANIKQISSWTAFTLFH